MVTDSDVYEERYRWSRRTTSVVIGGALSVAVSIGVKMPLLPTMALFAGGVLAVLWGVLQRRVALRVDAAGVTLGGSSLRYRGSTAVVPWADIVTVLLWQQVLPTGTLMPYVGLIRRRGAAPLAGSAGRGGQAAAGGLVPDIPADTMTVSRAVNGWQLSRRGLASAVTGFAPNVLVVDHDTGRVITEDQE
ncbi:MAG TPA: hypothetical protein VMV17_22845 [Streptosporangiaceae bacterium]|nr:hypothetical protein [Streptosporangiaceae bacterium]